MLWISIDLPVADLAALQHLCLESVAVAVMGGEGNTSRLGLTRLE
jgi:hypothetical protein